MIVQIIWDVQISKGQIIWATLYRESKPTAYGIIGVDNKCPFWTYQGEGLVCDLLPLKTMIPQCKR